MFTPVDVHIDQALSNLSIQFKNNALIASIVLPILPVKKESDKYYKYGKEAFKLIETARADGTKANEAHLKLSLADYACIEHALADIVTDRARANADVALNPELDTTEYLTDLILLRLEKEVATLFTTTGNFTNSNYSTLSGTGQWSDYANSTPLSDIKTAKASVRKLIGREATHIILAGDVAETLSLHPDIKDLRKYVTQDVLTAAGLPPMISGLKVVEGKAVENVAYRGVTESMAYIWGKNAIIAHIAPRPGLKTLSFGYTLKVTGYRKTKKWREEPRNGDMVEVSDMFVAKVVANECGYLFASAIA